jgi:hypothetical protein
MIKTKITMAIILISVVGMIVNSGGIAISNVQATADESDNTQSSNDHARSSDNSTTQTFGDELPPSDDNNKAQTSDDTNEVIPTNQELLPGLEQSNQQVLRFEETPVQTSNTSTKDIQNPDIKSELSQKTTSSQNGLRSNYLAEMPVLSDVKDCYKSDGKISLDGQWSCAEYNCTVINGIPKLCTPKVQGTTNDDNDKAKHIGNAFDLGSCKGGQSDPLCPLNK